MWAFLQHLGNTGLNLYILVLACTGTGKESIKRSITRLLSRVVQEGVLTAMDFIGPVYIASGQALMKDLADSHTKSYVSILPEVGLLFEQLTSDKANAAQLATLGALLDLYHTSGKNDVMHGMVYSQKKNNIDPVQSPAFTFVGESVPDKFYETVDERMITSGLLPRLTIIEYNGSRPKRNDKHAEAEIPSELLSELKSLVVFSLHRMLRANPYSTQPTFDPKNVQEDADAAVLLKQFGELADEQMRSTNVDVVLQLWNRAHLKALKYAAIGAISENIAEPIIHINIAKWAIHRVKAEVENLLQRFETGEIGKNDSENKQVNHIKRILRDYFLNDADYAVRYAGKEAGKMHKARIIPRKYLYKRISNLPAFKNDRLKTSGALDRSIDVLKSLGVLTSYSSSKLSDEFGTTQQAYLLTDTSFIEE